MASRMPKTAPAAANEQPLHQHFEQNRSLRDADQPTMPIVSGVPRRASHQREQERGAAETVTIATAT